MSKRVYVGLSYSEDSEFVALSCLTGTLAGVALLGFFADKAIDPMFALGCLGVAPLLAILVVRRFKYISKNMGGWLVVTEAGLTFSNKHGTRLISLAEIVDLAVSAASTLGGTAGRRVRFVLRDRDQLRTLSFDQYFAANEEDLFGPVLEGLLKGIATRTRSELEKGGALSGEGWELSRDGLKVQESDAEITIPIRSIAAVDWIDDGVKVWRVGEAEPVFFRRASSPGICVLYRVLSGFLAEAPSFRSETTETTLADGLGRVLFSHQAALQKGDFTFFVVLIVLAFAGSLACFWYGLTNFWTTPGTKAAIVAGTLLLLAAGWGTWALWTRYQDVFVCHTNGIVYTTWRGSRTLYYREISAFTFSGVRMFLNGAPMGTQVTFKFEPLDPAMNPISYFGTIHSQHEEFDRLRDHISRMIAGHMLGRLRNGQTVVWTPQLAFTPEGLVVSRVEKKGARGEVRIVPYDQLGEHEFKEGVFYLHTKDGFGRPIQDPVSQRNFFPGYYLMLLLNGAPQSASGAADHAEE